LWPRDLLAAHRSDGAAAIPFPLGPRHAPNRRPVLSPSLARFSASLSCRMAPPFLSVILMLLLWLPRPGVPRGYRAGPTSAEVHRGGGVDAAFRPAARRPCEAEELLCSICVPPLLHLRGGPPSPEQTGIHRKPAQTRTNVAGAGWVGRFAGRGGLANPPTCFSCG
jgi:hypothetical protein